jgi:hypothetical protein
MSWNCEIANLEEGGAAAETAALQITLKNEKSKTDFPLSDPCPLF